MIGNFPLRCSGGNHFFFEIGNFNWRENTLKVTVEEVFNEELFSTEFKEAFAVLLPYYHSKILEKDII